MNRKIPFHDLAGIIAAKSATDREEAEKFAKTFFELIADTLVKGESVRIKGLGTFAPSGDAENPVAFMPDQELADTVNAPFALFEPEIVGNDITDADLEAAVAADETPAPAEEKTPVEAQAPVETREGINLAKSETPAPTEPEPVSEPEPEPVAETPAEPEQQHEPEPVHEPEPAPAPVTPAPAPKPVPVTVPEIEEEPEEYVTPQPESSGPGFGWGFFTGLIVGLALGACGIYFALDYIFPTPARGVSSSLITIDEIEDKTPPVPVDSAAFTPAVPADEPETPAPAPEATQAPAPAKAAEAPAQTAQAALVRDTVKAGYLLNDMARKHYGSKVFWVYIYEENKSKIKNPNRVNVGTVVTIPPASKYGIDAKDPTSVAAANKKAGQILSKFPNR